MSTIASPRDTSLRRLPSGTPNSSTRPSLDGPPSGVTSPAPVSSAQHPPPPQQQQPSKRANRAALREYYNLRAPRIEVPDSEVPASDLDAPDFSASEHVARAVAASGLEDLLRLYTRVVGEVRALDAEKKALVYDNYSKLITATETIRKLRANMDPLNPMASTLDPAIAHIYTQASSIRDALRQSIPPPDSDATGPGDAEAEQRRRRTRELAVELLATPPRLRALVRDGKVQEAREQWERPRQLLEAWREQGLGGDDVQACIEEGNAALVGEEAQAQAETQGLGLRSKDGRSMPVN